MRWKATPAAIGVVLLCALLPGPAGATHSTTETVTYSQTFGDTWNYAGMSREAEHVFYTRNGALFDYANGTSTAVAPAPVVFNATSADGTRVIFSTTASLDPADTDTRTDIYQSVGGVRTLLSTGPAGGNGAIDAEYRGANETATRVFFTTTEQLVAADTDSARDLYERFSGTTTVLSLGPFGGNNTGIAQYGGASADGTRVFFATSDQLTSDDLDARQDVYEYSSGTVTRLSRGPIGGDDNRFSAFYGGNSLDGSKVYFQTREAVTTDDTDDDNRDTYEREGSTTTLVSTGPLTPSAAIAQFEGVSEDGSRVFFTTIEPMVVEDLDVRLDVYERSGGTTTLLSIGPTGGNGDIVARFEAASADGSRVFFTTPESLVPEDLDNANDLYERANAVTTLVSTGPASTSSFAGSQFNGISADGAHVFFSTIEQLVAEDTNTRPNMYERYQGVTYLMPNQAVVFTDPLFIDASRSGHKVAYQTGAQELAVAGIRSYVRPKGATPVRVPLVPAYAECTSANLVHGPPIEEQSCGPPQQASANLTVGTPEANGAAANSSGLVRLTATVGAPGPPTDSDIAIDVSISDVRCQAGVATCGPVNDEPGDDYTGELRLEAGNRITDLSSPDEFGDPDPLGATVQDASFPATIPCVATPETDRGGDCSVSTSVNAILPGSVLDGKRAIWALDAIRVLDGGADGDADTTGDNTLFATQGVFVP